MHPSRALLKGEIVAEFMAPRRKSRQVVILASGVPGTPSRPDLLEFFGRKGFWVFSPRYRGTWESRGKFLRISPHRDILDVIGELPKGFQDILSGRHYRVKPKAIYLVASSFGGAAALLAARDPRITKVVALSPVVDYRVRSKAESFPKLWRLVRTGFGGAYRFSVRDWKKLKSGTFFNPMARAHEIDGRKVFIIHSRDDDVVDWRSVARFAEVTGSTLWLLKRGGHFGRGQVMQPRFWRRVERFLRSK